MTAVNIHISRNISTSIVTMKSGKIKSPFQTEASAVFYCCTDKPKRKSIKNKMQIGDVIENRFGEENTKRQERRVGKIGKEVLFLNKCYYVFILV